MRIIAILNVKSIDADEHTKAQVAFGKFLDKLVSLDKDDALYKLICTEYSNSVRLLLDNEFVFKPFWGFQNGHLTEEEWKAKFASSKLKVNKAFSSHKTAEVLRVVLSSMYKLRNQLVHGGATWNSAVNREQLKDCTAFLVKLVPFIIELMLDNPQTVWGGCALPAGLGSLQSGNLFQKNAVLTSFTMFRLFVTV